MDQAIAVSHGRGRDREVQYRDGLLLALLSLWTIRRRSIAALTVSRHIERDEDDVTILLHPEDTKSGRPESFRVPMGNLYHDDSLAEFVREFHRELKRLQANSANAVANERMRLGKLKEQIDRLVVAISEGTDTPTMRQTLLRLENKKSEVQERLNAGTTFKTPPATVDSTRIFQKKIEKCEIALSSTPASQAAAAPTIRAMIDEIVLRPGRKARRDADRGSGSAERAIPFGKRPADRPRRLDDKGGSGGPLPADTPPGLAHVHVPGSCGIIVGIREENLPCS